MANSVSHAALPYPIKGARYSVSVIYLDADGDPTDPTTPDTEYSLDAGSFADCAEEVTTITGSNGAGYITLTGAETNGSLLVVCAKVASGPKATLLTCNIPPLAVAASGTLSAGSAGGGTLGTALGYDVAGCFIKTTGGTGGGGTGGANNQARRIVTYTPSTGAFTVAPNWETTPDNTTTYEVLLPEGVTLGMLKALNPTVAGRTLDVSTGGEAGVDWANVGSPTTNLNLSGTTVKTATDVEADTADIQSRLPAALVSGRMDASVGAYQSGQAPLQPTVAGRTLDVTAGGEAGIDWGNVGSPTTTLNLSGTTISTSQAVASVSGSVGSVAANGITASSLAADAGAELADAVWDEARSGHTTSGTFGEYVNANVTHSLGVAVTNDDGTAQAGGSTTITLASAASSTDQYYRGRSIEIATGTGAGQARRITDYVGSTRVATVDSAWAVNPDNTSKYTFGEPLGSVASGTGATPAEVWAHATRTLTAIDEDSTTLDLDATVRAAVGLASANLDTQIAAVQADTDDIQTRLPAALVGGRMDANVGAVSGDSAAADGLEALLDGTGSTLTVSTLTAATNAVAWNSAWDAEVQSEAEDALQSYHLDHLIASADPGAVVANNSFLAKLTSKNPTAEFSSYDNTTDSLQAVADAVQAVDDYVDSEVAAIKAKTDQLTFTTAGRVDATAQGLATGSITVDAIADGAITAAAVASDAVSEIAAGVWSAATRTLSAGTNIDGSTFTAIPWNAAWDAEVQSECADALTAYGASTVTTAQVNAEVVDALATDTYAEPTGAPAATASLAAKVNRLYQALRNQVTVTASAKTFFNDAGSALWSKALSDNGTTFSEAEGA